MEEALGILLNTQFPGIRIKTGTQTVDQPDKTTATNDDWKKAKQVKIVNRTRWAVYTFMH